MTDQFKSSKCGKIFNSHKELREPEKNCKKSEAADKQAEHRVAHLNELIRPDF